LRKLLLIIIILIPNYIWSQDYFFEFVGGWVSNFCFENDLNYGTLGLNGIEGFTNHELLVNVLDNSGNQIGNESYLSDSTVATAYLSTTSNSINFLSSSEILVGGYVRADEDVDSIEGGIIKYNFES